MRPAAQQLWVQDLIWFSQRSSGHMRKAYRIYNVKIKRSDLAPTCFPFGLLAHTIKAQG
jgi:hypothetical protein